MLHIAAENGMTLPLISVLRDREHGLLSRGQETLHTILMLVLQSGNYKLFIFLSEKVARMKVDCCFLLVSIMAHGFKGHVIGDDRSQGQLNDLIRVIDLELEPSIPVVSLT